MVKLIFSNKIFYDGSKFAFPAYKHLLFLLTSLYNQSWSFYWLVLRFYFQQYFLQSMRFTHERSFNEDCILHVRIPFFNWINVFLYIDWKITIFFRWTKSILQKVTRNIRNRLHGTLGRSANQLLQGCHPLSRILTSTRKQENGWVVAWTE